MRPKNRAIPIPIIKAEASCPPSPGSTPCTLKNGSKSSTVMRRKKNTTKEQPKQVLPFLDEDSSAVNSCACSFQVLRNLYECMGKAETFNTLIGHVLQHSNLLRWLRKRFFGRWVQRLGVIQLLSCWIGYLTRLIRATKSFHMHVNWTVSTYLQDIQTACQPVHHERPLTRKKHRRQQKLREKSSDSVKVFWPKPKDEVMSKTNQAAGHLRDLDGVEEICPFARCS